MELAGGRCVHVPLALPDFAVDWQRLSDAISPRTRLIFLNSPHNPSGALLTRADLDKLAELIRGRDIHVISDEVYEHLIYDGARHASVLAHDELYQRAFVVSSFGKTYHVTGWKTGYVVAPPALTAELRKIHQYVNFCGVTPLQFALADFMAAHPEHVEELPAFTRPGATCSAICWLARASPSPALRVPISSWPTIRPFAPIWTTWPWPSG